MVLSYPTGVDIGNEKRRAIHPALLDALLPGKGLRRDRRVPIPERTVLAANVVKKASTFFGRL